MTGWLITLQIQISIAVVAILILRWAMKKIPKIYSYLLWLLVFARLLIPVSVESRFSFMPSEQEREIFAEQILVQFSGESLADNSFLGGQQVEKPVENRPANSDAVGNPGVGSAMNNGIFSENTSGDGTVGSGITSGSATSDGTIHDNIVQSTVVSGEDKNWSNSATFDHLASGEDLTSGDEAVVSNLPGVIFMALWIVGVVAVLSYNGAALYRMRRLLGKEESPQIVTIVNPITDKEKTIPIYRCKNINTPFTLGLFKPAIYLPADLTEGEQEYILCHERVHISRKDNLVKHVAFLLTAIYWFNPFVWVAFFFMERDMEMSCDEKVIKLMGKDIKRNYSQSLLNFADGKSKMPATHLTFGENSVKQRVKNVLSYKNAKKWSLCIGAVVLVVVVVALFTTGRDESVQVDGQGSQAQDDTQQGDSSKDVTEGDDRSQESIGWDNSGNGPAQGEGSVQGENSDSTLSKSYDTPQLALEAWIADFMKENTEVTHGSHYYSQEEASATIEYSVIGFPDRYMMKETVNVVEKDGTYTVESVELTSYETIDSKDQLDEVYWWETSNRYWWNQLGYNDSFYRRVLQMLLSNEEANVEYGKRFTDPVTAAVELLNLGEGTGAVVGDLSAAEGTEVTVAYTFAKDNSVVEIPMVLGEGSAGIWGLKGTSVRIVFTSRWIDNNPEDVIQLSGYGFYRKNNEGLTCLYPYYVNPENVFTIQDGILYFVVDSGYWEGSLEYEEDAICMLNLATGEIDKNALQLGEMNRTTAPIKGIDVHDGFVTVTCNEKQYQIPLVNTGQTTLTTEHTYNGKPVIELTEEEQDAYGVLIRQQLLNHPGQVLKLSNRTLEETFALIDLDGDNQTEKISMKITSIQYFNDYQFRIGDSVIEDRGDYISNDIWAFSLDGKEIILAIYDDGSSGDPQTKLFRYEDGGVKAAGEFHEHIEHATIENGIIYTDERTFVIQTDGIDYQYKMNKDGELVLIEQEAYDFNGLNDIKLLMELPVHSAPGTGSEDVTYMQPQTVHFTMVDKTFEWIYVEGEDGIGGWFRVGTFGSVLELRKDCMEVFEGLSMAG